MLVLSDPPNGATRTPVTSRWHASQTYFAADTARPGATAKAGAGEPTIIDVAGDGVGDENATKVGWRKRAVWIAGPGVANVAAKVARSGGAPETG